MAGKKFRFSLHSVLKLRSHKVDRAQDALAQVLRRREDLAFELRRADEALNRITSETGESGRRSALMFQRIEEARRQAEQRRDRVLASLERLSVREREARSVLRDRLREKDALVRLRESEQETYWEAIRHADQLALDEQGILGYMKQRREAHS